MADVLSKSQRHYNMSMIKGKDTKPEIVLRHSLHAKGFRYRKNVKSLPGKPDIVLARYRTVIFVNGCFWHGHKDCPKFVLPKTNAEFWLTKIENNKERDLRNYSYLEALGWKTIVVWECELSKNSIDATVNRVQRELVENRERWLHEIVERQTRNIEWKDDQRKKRDRFAKIFENELFIRKNRVNNLFIVGNGFDLNHGIKSSYSDFRKWLKKNKPIFYGKLSKQYPKRAHLWKDFEENLPKFDISSYALSIYNSKVCNNLHFCELDELFERDFRELMSDMGFFFDTWARELPCGIEWKYNLNCERPFYLTFNYTPTLEDVYEIEDKFILHLHGCSNCWQDLIFGHGMTEDELFNHSLKTLTQNNDSKCLPKAFIELFSRSYARYFSRYRKDTDSIIRQHENTFVQFSHVSHIFIMGYSFSQIDVPYIDMIIASIEDIDNVIWSVFIYSEKDEIIANEFFESRSIRNFQISKWPIG